MCVLKALTILGQYSVWRKAKDRQRICKDVYRNANLNHAFKSTRQSASEIASLRRLLALLVLGSNTVTKSPVQESQHCNNRCAASKLHSASKVRRDCSLVPSWEKNSIKSFCNTDRLVSNWPWYIACPEIGRFCIDDFMLKFHGYSSRGRAEGRWRWTR